MLPVLDCKNVRSTPDDKPQPSKHRDYGEDKRPPGPGLCLSLVLLDLLSVQIEERPHAKCVLTAVYQTTDLACLLLQGSLRSSQFLCLLNERFGNGFERLLLSLEH